MESDTASCAQHTALEVNPDGIPQAFRHKSGLIVYEEGLRDGAWISRYWSPIGRAELDPVCRGTSEQNAAFRVSLGGQVVENAWRVVAVTPVAATQTGAAAVEVYLRHAQLPLEVTVFTLTDGTGLFTGRLTLRNTGDASLALTGLDVWAGRVFPCQFGSRYWGENSKYATAHGEYEVGYFIDNRHSNEGHFEWRPLGAETPFELAETSGKSGWGHPILYLRDGKAGNIFVIQLAWSGNWRIHADLVDGCVRVGIGPAGP